MKHLITITTYKRDNHLLHCLNAIKNLFKGKEYKILIFQDGEGDYTASLKYIKSTPHKWFKFSKPHGKQNFYKLHHFIYQEIRKYNFDLVHFIQDDCIPVTDYLDTVEKVMINNIDVLNTLTLNCHSRMFVTPTVVCKENDYNIIVGQRLDCNYVAKRAFFDKLDWKQVTISQNYDFRNGSGVGSHTTVRYITAGGNVHNIVPSLLDHIGFDSVIGNSIDYKNVRSILKNDNYYIDIQNSRKQIGYKYEWL